MKSKLRLMLLWVAMLAVWLPEPSTQAKPTVTYAGGDGSSEKKAVVVKARDEESGVHAEYAYLDRHYPGYQPGAQAAYSQGKRSYDRLEFTTAKGEKRTIFFDITSFYGKLD